MQQRGFDFYPVSALDPSFEESRAFLSKRSIFFNNFQQAIINWARLPDYLYSSHQHTSYQQQTAHVGARVGHLQPIAAQLSSHTYKKQPIQNPNVSTTISKDMNTGAVVTTTTIKHAPGHIHNSQTPSPHSPISPLSPVVAQSMSFAPQLTTNTTGMTSVVVQPKLAPSSLQKQQETNPQPQYNLPGYPSLAILLPQSPSTPLPSLPEQNREPPRVIIPPTSPTVSMIVPLTPHSIPQASSTGALPPPRQVNTLSIDPLLSFNSPISATNFVSSLSNQPPGQPQQQQQQQTYTTTQSYTSLNQPLLSPPTTHTQPLTGTLPLELPALPVGVSPQPSSPNNVSMTNLRSPHGTQLPLPPPSTGSVTPSFRPTNASLPIASPTLAQLPQPPQQQPPQQQQQPPPQTFQPPASTPTPSFSRSFKPPIVQPVVTPGGGSGSMTPSLQIGLVDLDSMSTISSINGDPALSSPQHPGTPQSSHSRGFRAPTTPKQVNGSAAISDILKGQFGINSIEELVGGLKNPTTPAPINNSPPTILTNLSTSTDSSSVTPRTSSVSVSHSDRPAPMTPSSGPRMQAPSTPKHTASGGMFRAPNAPPTTVSPPATANLPPSTPGTAPPPRAAPTFRAPPRPPQ